MLQMCEMVDLGVPHPDMISIKYFKEIMSEWFHNNWEEFKTKTGGLLYVYDEYGQLNILSPHNMGELQPYMDSKVEELYSHGDYTRIVLL